MTISLRPAAEAKMKGYVAGQGGQEPGVTLTMALEAMDGAFPGFELVVTDTMTDRDHVAIHFAVSASRTGNKLDSAEGILIYRIAEGKIAEHWLQPGVPDLSPAPAWSFAGIVW